MKPPPIPGLLLALAVLVTGAAALHSCTGCAALTAAAPALLQGAEGGIVALLQAEAARSQIPPGDPAFVAALAGARALEAESLDAGAAISARLDAILAEMHRRRARCPGVLPTLDAGAVGAQDGGR